MVPPGLGLIVEADISLINMHACISKLASYAKHNVFPWLLVNAMNNTIALICGSIWDLSINRLITNHSYVDSDHSKLVGGRVLNYIPQIL